MIQIFFSTPLVYMNEYRKPISPLPCEGAAGLDVPLVVFDRGELEALGDLGHRHATFHILLVGKNKEPRFS